jgi:hypothetical protein
VNKKRETKKTNRSALGREEYQELKRRLYVKQKGRCADCGRARPLQLHHAVGRGIGGWRRDDKNPRNRLLCSECHPKADRERNSKFGDGGN